MRSSALLSAILFALATPVRAETMIEAEADAVAEAAETTEANESAGGGGEQPLEQIQVTATRAAESNFDVSSAVTVIGQDEIREKAAADRRRLLARAARCFRPVDHAGPGDCHRARPQGIGSPAYGRRIPHEHCDLPQLAEPIFRACRCAERAAARTGARRAVHPVWLRRDGWRRAYPDAGRTLRRQFLGWPRPFPRAVHERRSVEPRPHRRSAGKDGISISGGVTVQDVGLRKLGGDGGRQPYTDFSSWAADTKLLWSPTAGHEFMLSAAYLKQPKTARVDELVTSFHQTRPNSSEAYFQPQDRLFVQARYVIDQEAGCSTAPSSMRATRKSTTTAVPAISARRTANWNRTRAGCAASRRHSTSKPATTPSSTARKPTTTRSTASASV